MIANERFIFLNTIKSPIQIDTATLRTLQLLVTDQVASILFQDKASGAQNRSVLKYVRL